MDFAEQITIVIVKLTDTLNLAQTVMQALNERITAVENRQDTLWEALQGITEHLSKEVESGNRD